MQLAIALNDIFADTQKRYLLLAKTDSVSKFQLIIDFSFRRRTIFVQGLLIDLTTDGNPGVVVLMLIADSFILFAF